MDPVEGAIAVNIGDMLMRWSDDALLSNLHRVRMPSSAAEAARPRYSCAFFLQADKRVTISGRAKKHAPMIAGDYLQMRIRYTNRWGLPENIAGSG